MKGGIDVSTCSLIRGGGLRHNWSPIYHLSLEDQDYSPSKDTSHYTVMGDGQPVLCPHEFRQ